MAVPQSKDELLAAMRASYASLGKALARVPRERFFEATLDGHAKHGKISVANLLAYLIGWNGLVLKWHQREAAGLAVDFPETGYRWNQLGSLAQKFYRDCEPIRDPDALLALLDERYQALTRLVEGFSDAQLYGSGWHGEWTRGRMIQFNSASPYRNARGRIASWLRQIEGQSPDGESVHHQSRGENA